MKRAEVIARAKLCDHAGEARDVMQAFCDCIDNPQYDHDAAQLLLLIEMQVAGFRERMRHIRHTEAGEPTP